MRKNLLPLTFVLFLALALTACGSKTPAPVVGEESTVYTNQGYTLSIPNEYADLLLIEQPAEEGGMLFRVSEQASVDASKKLFPGEPAGGGFLFGIGLVSEEELRAMQCHDMSGRQVFAKDSDGRCYIYYHPTDVQLLREGEYSDADWEQWTALCEWAAKGGDIFMSTNEGLTPYYRTNTELDIYLNRLAYLEEDEFALTRPGSSDMLVPSKELSLPYLKQLMSATFTYADDRNALYSDPEKTPDCEHISLYLPDAGLRFDFFLADNGEANYIRRVQHGGFEDLYLAVFEDGTLAGQIMLDWYIAAMQEQ